MYSSFHLESDRKWWLFTNWLSMRITRLLYSSINGLRLQSLLSSLISFWAPHIYQWPRQPGTDGRFPSSAVEPHSPEPSTCFHSGCLLLLFFKSLREMELLFVVYRIVYPLWLHLHVCEWLFVSDRFPWCHGLMTWKTLSCSTFCLCLRNSVKPIMSTPSWTSCVNIKSSVDNRAFYRQKMPRVFRCPPGLCTKSSV